MIEIIEKKEIVLIFCKMVVGECEVFFLSQVRLIGSMIYGVNLVVECVNGYKWFVKINIEKKMVIVIRIQ